MTDDFHDELTAPPPQKPMGATEALIRTLSKEELVELFLLQIRGPFYIVPIQETESKKLMTRDEWRAEFNKHSK